MSGNSDGSPSQPSDPPNGDSEEPLWVLSKGNRRAEARLCTAPANSGPPELRIYASSPRTGDLERVWLSVLDDGRPASELALTMKKEFQRKGWVDV
jgi:hypothetical protein